MEIGKWRPENCDEKIPTRAEHERGSQPPPVKQVSAHRAARNRLERCKCAEHPRSKQWHRLLISRLWRDAFGHARHKGAGVGGYKVDFPAVQDDHSLLVPDLATESDCL
jgi:hypothetical protein